MRHLSSVLGTSRQLEATGTGVYLPCEMTTAGQIYIITVLKTLSIQKGEAVISERPGTKEAYPQLPIRKDFLGSSVCTRQPAVSETALGDGAGGEGAAQGEVWKPAEGPLCVQLVTGQHVCIRTLQV